MAWATSACQGLSPTSWLPAMAQHDIYLELTFYQERSYHEIAEITRCPVNTVKTRMFHARKRLAPLLTALGIGRRPASPEVLR